MRLQGKPHLQNIVILSSSVPACPPRGPTRGPARGALRGPTRARPSRAKRIRWWLRTGTLLAIIGVLRLARATRTCWEPVSLLAGLLLTIAGLTMPVAGAFLLGLLVLIVTLLKGIREQRQGAS
jgi:hypothetical protein